MGEETTAQQKKNLTMALESLDSVIHAANYCSRPDALGARLLYDLAGAVLHCPKDDTMAVSRLSPLAHTRGYLLRMPPITWGVGDAVAIAPQASHEDTAGCHYLFVLPTNTNLATHARSVLRARKRFGDEPFDGLKATGKAELGGQVITGAGRFAGDARISHTVCRHPGDARIKELNLLASGWSPVRCCHGLGYATCPATRLIIPFWGAAREMDLWVRALHYNSDDLQTNCPSILIRFMEDQRDLGFELERRLIQEHQMIVGRESGCGIDEDWGDFGQAPWAAMSKLVTPNGRFTPDVYANWRNSGVTLSSAGWYRQYTILMRREAEGNA